MEKKNINWSDLGFEYQQTELRYVSNYKDGAWDEGGLTSDANVVINECAGVLQYAQTVFEGLKAYTTEDGRIVTFRPDLNAERLIASSERLEIPAITKEKFRSGSSRQRGFCPAVRFRSYIIYQTVYLRV